MREWPGARDGPLGSLAKDRCPRALADEERLGLVEAADRPVKTYSVGFDVEGYDEGDHAETVSRLRLMYSDSGTPASAENSRRKWYSVVTAIRASSVTSIG